MNRLNIVMAMAMSAFFAMPAVAQDYKPLCDVLTELMQDNKKALGTYAGKETPNETFEPKLLPKGATEGEVYLDPMYPKRSYENTYAAAWAETDKMEVAVDQWKQLKIQVDGCAYLNENGTHEEELFVPEGTNVGGRATWMWEANAEEVIEWIELFVTYKKEGDKDVYQVRVNLAKGKEIQP